jgi:hypothetical protein
MTGIVVNPGVAVVNAGNDELVNKAIFFNHK